VRQLVEARLHSADAEEIMRLLEEEVRAGGNREVAGASMTVWWWKTH